MTEPTEYTPTIEQFLGFANTALIASGMPEEEAFRTTERVLAAHDAEVRASVVAEEPEWEYGYRPTYGEMHPSKAGERTYAIWVTRRTPDNWRPEMGEVYRRTAEKVIPAGPWVPVEN